MREPTKMELQALAAFCESSVGKFIDERLLPIDEVNLLDGVRAVIRALSAPTAPMIKAGERRTDTYYSEDGDFENGWCDAIDAASPPC